MEANEYAFGIKAVHKTINYTQQPALVEAFSPSTTARVLKFHQSFPQYKTTPLANLSFLAKALGVQSLYIKDESNRFGLSAFKVLGGSYAIARAIAERLSLKPDSLSYELLQQPQLKEKISRLTFVTATDGNHGRGIAWTARQLGCRSVVFMPKGSSRERLENIRHEGAQASITDLNYDDAVRQANAYAADIGGIMVQDTSWEGYEQLPLYIMQGYATMAREALEQLAALNTFPTHIFLQAGVGAMSGAVTGCIAAYCLQNHLPLPYITVVEPDQADCLYRTALADDGKLHFVSGHMNSIMAGLNCGEPCTLGWQLLSAYAQSFCSIPDSVAATGMRLLAAPVGEDPVVVSGESGAAGFGLAAVSLLKPQLAALKKDLHLTGSSIVLCFSTEGATDTCSYRSILWEGAHPL